MQIKPGKHRPGVEVGKIQRLDRDRAVRHPQGLRVRAVQHFVRAHDHADAVADVAEVFKKIEELAG